LTREPSLKRWRRGFLRGEGLIMNEHGGMVMWWGNNNTPWAKNHPFEEGTAERENVCGEKSIGKNANLPRKRRRDI